MTRTRSRVFASEEGNWWPWADYSMVMPRTRWFKPLQTGYPGQLEVLAPVPICGDFCCSNQVAVAVGGIWAPQTASIVASSDGVTWSGADVKVGAFEDVYAAICYGKGIFVAVGNSAVASGTVCTFSDGLVWTHETDYLSNPFGVCFGNKTFVAVGDRGEIATSQDGTNWSIQYPPPGEVLRGVAYLGGVFVAVGDNGVILVSSDNQATSWKQISSGVNSALRSVCYGDGLAVAVGDAGTVLKSKDGQAWKVCRSGTEELSGVCYADGIFVAVGGKGVALSSIDGADWVPRDLKTTYDLSAIAYFAETFIAVGKSGTIVQSDSVEDVQIISLTSNVKSPQAVGAAVTWTCDATGPQPLSYAFAAWTGTAGPPSPSNFTSKNTFQITFGSTGTHNVTAYAKDSIGRVAELTATLVVLRPIKPPHAHG